MFFDGLVELDRAAEASRRLAVGRALAVALVTAALTVTLGLRAALIWFVVSLSFEALLQAVTRRLVKSEKKALLRFFYLVVVLANNTSWAAIGILFWCSQATASQLLGLLVWASLLANAASFSFQSPIAFGAMLLPVAAAMLSAPSLWPRFFGPQQLVVQVGLFVLVGYVVLGARRNIVAAGELAQSKRELERALVDAEAANAAKSGFLAVMSHEIRTPLNGVIGMAQAMDRDPLPPVQRDRLGVIRQSSEILLRLLNDLLDLSRIEAGKMELEDGLIDMGVLVEGARATFMALSVDKDISLEAELAPAASGFWRGDAARVRQIIDNLISNAVKFTSAGSVRVVVDYGAEGLEITVADTGQGIPPDRIGNLFEKFVQADVSTTRRFGGSGLGLAICRELAEMMGGSVAATSEVDVGSTFTLILPLEKSREGDEVAPETAFHTRLAAIESNGSSALRVLVAEDHPVNQRVLQTLLSQLGIEATIVSDGAQAVEAVEFGGFDIVLMDVQMPVMDGVAATRAIRAREAKSGTRTPIVALTANAMTHHFDEYRVAGMDGFAAKPIQLSALIAEMRRVIGDGGRSESESASIARAAM